MKKYLAILLLFISCTDSAFFEQNKAITNRKWEYKDQPSFEVKIEDKQAKYDVYLNIRHTHEYDFSNLFILLHRHSKGIADTAIRKELSFAELDGKWKGKAAGNLYEIESLALQNVSFPDTGIYTFAIEQNMRINPLLDISDVGIKIIKK